MEQTDLNSMVLKNLLEGLGNSVSDFIIPDSPRHYPLIDEKQAKWIDHQVDWRDAVSLTFLMVDNRKVALNIIQ